MGKNKMSRREFLQASAAGLSFVYLPGVGRVKANPFEFTESEDTFGRLCYNENPLGPSHLALEAMRAAAYEGNRYPDWFSSTLEARIAEHHSVSPNMICAGTGATEIIRLVADAFLYPDDEMVTASPTYSQMASEAASNGAAVVHVPVNERYVIDLNMIRAAMGPKTKLISLVNPNNPQGTIFTMQDMRIFMNSLPPGVIVVVDEAYHHYVHSPFYESCIRYVKEGFPMIVIRTFSKVYGLAGVRIGYSLASAGYTSMIQSSQNIGMVSRLGQEAAIASLDDIDHVDNTVSLNDHAKEILVNGLTALQLEYIPSETNFMMFDTGMSATSVASQLANRGYQVRVGWGMPRHIRVSTGTVDEMYGFINALQAILGQNSLKDGPPTFGLSRVHPNPFTQRCTIQISTLGNERVRLAIYDAAGRMVQSLLNGVMASGLHDIVWDGRDVHGRNVASGLYIINLMQGEFATSTRVTLIR
jgi:histidinol-phosphate aminotransferase